MADNSIVAQAMNNLAAVLATISGPFTIAALTKRDSHTGWRYFYVSDCSPCYSQNGLVLGQFCLRTAFPFLQIRS